MLRWSYIVREQMGLRIRVDLRVATILPALEDLSNDSIKVQEATDLSYYLEISLFWFAPKRELRALKPTSTAPQDQCRSPWYVLVQ